MRCEFLPPYSPDYNPIELFFSAMKYHLRRNGQYIRFTMTDLTDNDIHLARFIALVYRMYLDGIDTVTTYRGPVQVVYQLVVNHVYVVCMYIPK